MKIFLWFLAICFVIGLLVNLWPIFAGLLAIFIGWKIYEAVYFKGQTFRGIKSRIQDYIKECNELNTHIEELKDTPLEINKLDAGSVNYQDKSKWNLKKSTLKERKYAPNIHHCTKSVFDGASREPFKYVCKYFGVEADEETLQKFEALLNNFEAAEDGKIALQKERGNILDSIQSEIPALIKRISRKRLERELGFDAVDFKTVYFPKYVFQYTSPGGNTSRQYNIVMDLDNLNKFVVYLSEKIKYKKSAAGQRALMTSKLRREIKERDHFTCQHCGVSLSQEPHLLLEIDHIVPVSKGGLTTEDNLQTLCWRCNRSKGAKTQPPIAFSEQ